MLIRPAISSMYQCIAKVLFFVFLGSLCLHMNAQSSGKIVPKVTITSRSITISEVFKMIRKQTGKVIWYRNEDVNENKKVNVNFKDARLEDVLKFLFQASDISWTYDDEAIILRKKKLSDNTSSSIVDTSLSPIQLITVTGKVTDEKGSPIIGATVVLKGNNQQGTTTNADGFFTLGAVKENASIVVSSVSFLTQEIPVRGRKSVGSVVMKEYVNELDVIQILAYGTTTRRLNTGNIATIKGTDIAKNPVQNPLLALQGRATGVFVEQATGYANSGVKVRIQGQNSIQGGGLNKGNDPLYVVDGIPYVSQLVRSIDNNALGNSGNSSFGGNPLSFINPNDIESIDVLKDADATSIYGSRAANGAILITTKKGKVGETKVDLTIQNGWGRVPRKMDLLNTKQYLEMRKEAKSNDNSPIIANNEFGDIDLVYWSQTENTNWQKTLIGNIAKRLDAQASVSGGNATTQFILGGSYNRQTTVIPGDFEDQKASFHISLNNISKNHRFKTSFSTNYLYDNNSISTVDLTSFAITLAPNAPKLYNANGSLNWETVNLPSGEIFNTWINPLQYTKRRYKIKTNNLIANATISYEILPGLNIKSLFGYTNLLVDEISTSPIGYLASHEIPTATRMSRFADNNINSFTIEPQLSYQRALGRGQLDAIVGTTIYQNDRNGMILSASGFNSDLILEDIKSATVISVDGSTTVAKYKYNALFMRLNYNWSNKYLFSLNARRDGTSRFGPENRFHNFGSISGAWLFSNEKFLRVSKDILSFGKLRASYGSTGNDQIDDYGYLSLYQNTFDQGNPYQGIKGLEPRGIENAYLQWEETKKLQVGLDLGFSNDRVLLALNYNRNRSSNQLLSYGMPPSAGFETILANFPATVENSGWELSVTGDIIHNKDFSWTGNFNLTIPKNRLIDFPNLSTSTFANKLVIGESINIQKTYQFEGVNLEAGLYQFMDSKGSLTSTPNNATDRIALINPDPTFYGGISNTLNYKGISLDILFQFVKQRARDYYFGPFVAGWVNFNQPTSILNRWQKEGDQKPYQKYNSDGSLYSTYDNAANNSDRGWGDASYIRLKNVSISYTLSQTLQQKCGLKGARVFVQGQNLFTITNYKGLDPETKSSSVLPPLAVVTVGVQISL